LTKKVYIYPITNRFKAELDNPYLRNLMDSLQPDFKFVNRPHPSDTGFFNFIRYFFGVQYIFFNWIEDLPDKKFGHAQTLFLFFICRLFHLKGGKIVWTLHNKLSHYSENIPAKKKLFQFLLSQSDFILTHAEEGKYFLEKNGSACKNILVIPHPVVSEPVGKADKPEYDLLIWGTLPRYKGVDKFLSFLQQQGLSDKYRIVISGKILDADYERELRKYVNENIVIRNEFLSGDELKHLVSVSRFNLFTYHSDSVLSSGALMDALGFGAYVIGPDTGAFHELAEEKIIRVFNTYQDVIGILESGDNGIDESALNRFVNENSWKNFSQKIKEWLKG